MNGNIWIYPPLKEVALLAKLLLGTNGMGKALEDENL